MIRTQPSPESQTDNHATHTPMEIESPPVWAVGETLPVPVIQFDSQDRIVGWNRAAGALYGLDADFARGQSVLLFVPHQELELFTQACAAVRRFGQWVGRLTHLTATGEPRLIEAHWTSTTNGDILAVHLDRTAQWHGAEAQLRATCWNAIRKMSAATVAECATTSSDHATALTQLKRFCEDPDPTTNIVYRASGQCVLVVGGGRLRNALIVSLLEAAGYRVRSAADRHDAIRLIMEHPERIRAAVLGEDVADRDFASELRGHRPLLPLVRLSSDAALPGDEGWAFTIPLPVEPQTVLEAVAEAVAADQHCEFSNQTAIATETSTTILTAV